MYDDLVATLRRQCIEMDCGNCNTCVKRKAADAIEELVGFVQEAERDRDEYRERLDKTADAIEKLSKPRWISVKERLPELCQNVLVSDGKGSGEGWLDRYDWHDPNREDVVYTSPQPRDFWCIPGCKVDEDHVTHWMPLPEPPKEET